MGLQESKSKIVFILLPFLYFREDQKGGFRKEYHIIFVPRKSLLCEKKLKEAGVHGSLTNIEEFSLTLIPFDSDLLSMEIENSFRVGNLYRLYSLNFFLNRNAI